MKKGEGSMPQNSMQKYILYSFLLHSFFVVLSLFFGTLKEVTPPTPQVLSLEIIEPKTPSSMLLKKKNSKKQTLVEQNRLNNELDPLAQHLSSHNQRVLKETVAKAHGEFQNIHIKPKTLGGVSANQGPRSQRPQNRPLPQDLFGSYKQSLAKTLEDLSKKNKKGLDIAGGDISRTRDYLPGKDEGLETLLSTREFVYFTYYNRIRNQLSQFWEPKIKQKLISLLKQGRQIASSEDRITKVQIILDQRGDLQRVQVIEASGVKDLDQIAVDAFRAAAPFPNPPKGIIESDGTVKIQWDFVIES